MKASWKTVKLNDVSELLADGDWIESKDQSDDGIRLIQTGNIGDGIFKDREEKARYISESTFKRLRCTEIFEGDCLVSRLPEPVGRSCILPRIPRSITAVDCSIIRFETAAILPEYFCYYSQSRDYQRSVESKTSGTTRKRISRSHLSEIEIPLPPLAEQKRIVALLDEAFAGIDEAKAKAEERKLLSGELSDACLESFLSDDSGWITTSVSECADINTGFAFKSSGFSKSSTDVRLLGGDNIINGAIRWENIRRWPKGDSQNYQNFFLSSGDIVLAMDRPIVNSGLKIAMVCADDLPALLIQRTARLRAKDGVSADFLYLALNSARFINHLNNSQKGVGVPHVSARQIGSFSIKLPPRHEQERITTLLSKIISSSAHVALNSARALSNLSELKQSLLTQAFAGELTA